MQSEKKNICRQFENEVWLYISEELNDDRKLLLDKHVAECDECAALLYSNRKISLLYKENMTEDMLDSSFERILENATSKISPRQKIKYFFKNAGKSFVFGKIVFGSALVTALVVIMLFSQRQNPIKLIAEKANKLGDSTIASAIEEASKSAFAGKQSLSDKKEEEWNNSIDKIEDQIKSMEKEINKN